MVEKPVVFVLGAGASMPFKFPSGRELLWDVIKTLRDEKQRTEIRPLLSTNVDLQAMGEHLQACGLAAIDTWLERNPDFIEAGKTLIAWHIGCRENLKTLQQDSWYRVLWEAMVSGCATLEDLARNKVSFVTFNYERSLETFLMMSAKNLWRKKIADCAPILNEIPIVHVYGRVGYLPWQARPKDAFVRDYGTPTMTMETAHSAVATLKIMPEGNHEGPEFQAARRLLKEASAIYFLGFGYHRWNLERIRFEPDRVVEVMGTLFPKLVQIPEKFSDGRFNGFGHDIKLVMEPIETLIGQFANVLHRIEKPRPRLTVL